ncbi:MAG TPA: tetratricopeptide repeat protein [Terriglobales bacterium]|jgi:tetratricopeptide (TPR) repeat protein|nr:tetratricopeptide repeat protein [Terriglobales bacterium]
MSPTIQATRGFSASGNVTALVHVSGKLAILSVTSSFRKSQLASVRTLFFTMFLVCSLCVPSASAVLFQSKPATLAKSGLTFRPTDPLNEEAFDAFYNLDYDRSIQDFQKIVDRHPDDAFAINHLITALIFAELNRMGALNTGEYSNDSFVSQGHRPADPKAKERIKQLIDRALKLEDARLEQNSKDVDALYARGVTRGQFALYTALVERAWFSALRNAVGARHDHERVLELSPDYVDAKLIVGSHNYVMGSLPWGVKVAVSLVGLSGSKEKGIQYLYDAAHAPGETSIDSKIALLVFLRREHRFDEALALVRELQPRYPKNYLLLLEEGNLERSRGHAQQAADIYRKVMEQGRAGKYVKGQHYEIAAIALGDLLRSTKDFTGAAAAYDQVSQIDQPDPELAQRANLGSGEMYDLLKQRDQAVHRYQAVIALNSSTPPAETARRRLQEPFRE